MAAEPGDRFAHVYVRERVESREFSRSGGGDPKIRDVESRTHGPALLAELRNGIDSAEEGREALPDSLAELRAIGVVVVLEGADATYPLKLDSLDRLSQHTTQPKRPLWTLLSVAPGTDDLPERATVWISDAYRERFVRLFEDYIDKQTPNEHPQNRELVANIGRIREAVIADLWQSSGQPSPGESGWWEIWLTPGAGSVERLEAYVAHQELRIADRVLRLNDRTVSWVHGEWAELERVPFTSVPVTEIRRPDSRTRSKTSRARTATSWPRTCSTGCRPPTRPWRRWSATSTPECGKATSS